MTQNPSHHPLVSLARLAIERGLGETSQPLPLEIPGFEKPAGAFVSIKKKGQLRGCIGTIEPLCSSLVEEVARNAVSAATRDPRFPPLTREELGDITISVDVLASPEPVSGLHELDPVKYGVIVQRGVQRGLLLPDLPGVDTVEKQVAIAMEKAGLAFGEPVELFRFEVKRFQ